VQTIGKPQKKGEGRIVKRKAVKKRRKAARALGKFRLTAAPGGTGLVHEQTGERSAARVSDRCANSMKARDGKNVGAKTEKKNRRPGGETPHSERKRDPERA